MREPKKVYEYYDEFTVFETQDKELAVIVYKYIQKNADKLLAEEISILEDDIKNEEIS